MLERVSDFHGISKDEYLELVEHMKREGYLFEAGGSEGRMTVDPQIKKPASGGLLS